MLNTILTTIKTTTVKVPFIKWTFVWFVKNIVVKNSWKLMHAL